MGQLWTECFSATKNGNRRKKEQITHTVENTTAQTTQTNISVKVGGSIKVLTADASASITDTLQNVRKESTTSTSETEQTNMDSLALSVPAYSILTWTVTENGIEATVKIDGWLLATQQSRSFTNP